LACGVIGCLVELVVGAGVVVFHNRPTMTPRPATNHSPTPPLRITNRSNRLTRSGLVQQSVTGQPAFCGFLGRRGITHFLASLEFFRQRVPAHRRSVRRRMTEEWRTKE
jgi:hypothetical protein